MDGENNGKPYFLMDDLGVWVFLETPISHLVGLQNFPEAGSAAIGDRRRFFFGAESIR